MTLRAMAPEDWTEVGALIRDSLNAWYEAHALGTRFEPDSTDPEWFCRIYEAMDPGCCVVEQEEDSGRLTGSCFYHPRPTHVSLGIMSVHPAEFGCGVARRLLGWITEFAAERSQPVRLVSSAMNLDSFSLYTRAGFTPYALLQTLQVRVSDSGFAPRAPMASVREARVADVEAIVELERQISGIERPDDYRHFVANQLGIWHVSVHESRDGEIDGCLVSVDCPASTMLGPGVARDDDVAAALIAAELDGHRGRAPVWLVPADRPRLIRTMYDWGARNTELHVAQVLGEARVPAGVVMPTFMPETG